MKEKLILKHRGDFNYFLISRTDNSEALMASLNPDEEMFEQKLSKQNCDEIFGVVDVENPHKRRLMKGIVAQLPLLQAALSQGWEEGFNKAMELNKDKVFTLEQAVEIAKILISNPYEKSGKTAQELVDAYIQSLQQPTEIEVEIVMYTKRRRKHLPERVPLPDSEGCLILKKI